MYTVSDACRHRFCKECLSGWINCLVTDGKVTQLACPFDGDSSKSSHGYAGPPSSGEVLVIGCGNSTQSEDMFAQGYTCVTSIDFSDVVIQEMTTKTCAFTNAITNPKN